MRYVTIRRNKSFVGCLISAKIYVEDPMYGDTIINATTCRKLGELKNGEEHTFQVSENAVKIFVIADKLSKGFCSEFYQLEAGTEPVILTGQNRFSLAAGNAFRFDNNNNPEALANRKKGSKAGIWVLIAAAVLGAVIGFLATSGILAGKADPKTFTANGMSITLTDAFKEASYDGFTAGYESKNIAVVVLQEAFAMYPGLDAYSISEYAALAIEVNELDSTVENKDGLCYFEYSASVEGEDFRYISYVFKENDGFWMIQFLTSENDAQSHRQEITEFAKSISFDFQ